MLSSQLDPEVSRLLKAKDEGPIICRECGEWKDRSECWTSRKICKSCGSKYNSAKWLAQDPAALNSKRRKNAVLITIKYLDKINVDGQCVICECSGFHADKCEAGILLSKLKAIQ